MASRVRGILENLLRRRRELALSEVVGDAELLRRFTATRDEAAFELLVWRHGTMVLGVCRRALRDAQLAEDAFQAVFLVLARKAGSIRGGNVAGWLFRIARRVAARAARRRPRLQPLPELITAPQAAAVEEGELTEILDAEVARLPDNLRRAVILCYLGGQTTEDAARELGCPRGTVLSRLATARKRLAERLARRGVTAPLLGAAVGHQTSGRLISQTIAAARTPFHLPATTGPALLAESVVHAMATTKGTMIFGAVMLAAGLTCGISWVAAGTGSTDGAQDLAADQPSRASAAVEVPKDNKTPARTAVVREQAEVLSQRIDDLRARLLHEALDEGMVDLSVLQAELFAVDRQVLQAEKLIKIEKRGMEQAIKNRDSASTVPIDKLELASVVDQDPDVREAVTRLSRASQAVEAIKNILPGENVPPLKVANSEVLNAVAGLKVAREQAVPNSERQIRDRLTRNHASSVDRYKERIENETNNLAELQDMRQQLAKRIAEMRQVEMRRQSLQDELKVLREIQLEVLRLRTINELRIEGLQPAMSPVDLKIDAQIKDLKREIEVLRAEVEKFRKKH